MSTLLDQTRIETEPQAGSATAPAQRLRTTMAAVRVSLRWLGVRKTLSVAQKDRAADAFGAEGSFLSAGKKLLDTKHPAFKAVTAIKNRVIQHWKSQSLPFPETGVRLIRQDRIAAFDARLAEFRDELEEAVAQLDLHYHELKQAARERLGTLYNEADYPATLIGLFAIEHDFPSVEPPDYLEELNPRLYAQECRRVQERFDEAVRLAEEAFLGELSKLVSHLTERLSGCEDGKPKVFRNSAVGNLREFFDRFRQLNVRSNQELDDLVNACQRVILGVEPESLRENADLREHVADQLARVENALDGLLVDRPRRNILRRPR